MRETPEQYIHHLNSPDEGQKMASRIATAVVLISFSMLFASLLLGFVYFRLTSAVWPPMGMEKIPLWLPSLSTVIVILSSVALLLYERTLLSGKTTEAKRYFILTLVLGTGFLGSQFFLWNLLKSRGLYASSGIFPSLIYGLTWVHAAHMAAAFLLLLYLIPMFSPQVLASKGEARVQNICKFWHFLGVVWIVMHIAMFVF